MGHDRQSALRELLVRAWQPLLERSRDFDAFIVERRGRGWRTQHARGAAAVTALRGGANLDSTA